MADKLTPQQNLAVHNRGGRLLVSAAAGSGKTKVLVDRLLLYLTDPADPANIDDFLLITYTKAAASELRAKIAEKLSERIALEPENRHLQKQMQRLFLTKISTVHGFCTEILREYAYRLDIAADFRVADENESRELRDQVLLDLLDRAYERAEEDPDFRAFVDSQGLGRDDRQVPKILQKVYDSALCHLDPQGWLDVCLQDANLEGVTDAAQTVCGDYLVRELKDYLDCHIHILERCTQALRESENMEKPAANFAETLAALRTLRSSETWDDIVSHREIPFGRLTFPRKNVDQDLIDRVKAARNACKKGLEKKLRNFADPSSQVIADLNRLAPATRGLIALVRRFLEEYARVKRSRRLLDFGDLEQRTLDLLLGKRRDTPTQAAAEIGSRFREIMVDEYQDSNGVQDAIFEVLTRRNQNCFMVGDVKQSIYQFRLADPGIFLRKYQDYLPAEEALPGEGRKVLLSHNFRSGGEVVEAVNDVFTLCASPRVGGLYYGEEEALREGIHRKPLPDPAVELCALEVSESAYPEEAAFVADRISQMLSDGTVVRKGDDFAPVQPEDIVILLRSPNSVGSYFLQALEARGIRCASGSGTDLLQTEEIGMLRSLLQIIVNPRQDIPLVAALAGPVFDFSADDLAAIRSGRRGGTIYDALLKWEDPKGLRFRETLEILRREAMMQPLPLLLDRILELTRMDSIYGARSDGAVRRANLQTFYAMAADFAGDSQRDLGQFLEHLTLLEEKGLIAESGKGTGAVTIMSIHKSKGLEFPVVFLAGLARGFNQESLRAQVLCDQELGLGLSVADNENRVRYPSLTKRAIIAKMEAESVSEELRVLYVALTRARDRLIMTYAPRSLASAVADTALRMDFDNGSLICRDADCPGDWVLLTALGRTEAGELFALGGRPGKIRAAQFPWRIRVVQTSETEQTESQTREEPTHLPMQTVEKLRSSLTFRYAHEPATRVPSKQTATGRKGRVKDAEAAEYTAEPKARPRDWRTPSFLGSQQGGTVYGHAIHAAMQYIRYRACTNEESVRREVERLWEEGFLSRDQADMVDCAAIAAFFETEPGRKLRSGAPHLREFKFSILDDAAAYGEGLEGEQVLLQGVVDCALLESDGITILDFKSDRVTEQTIARRAELYRPQVETYAEALGRIYELPVKKKLLYFFHLNRFLEL